MRAQQPLRGLEKLDNLFFLRPYPDPDGVVGYKMASSAKCHRWESIPVNVIHFQICKHKQTRCYAFEHEGERVKLRREI
jgi:hypothetical protein